MCAFKCGFITSFKKDDEYRKKFILTLATCFSYVTLASVVLQFGTALPDLRQLLAIDLEKASWLFTARSIGFLCGCLVYGLIYDRYNRLVIMAVCSIGTALATLLIPFLLYYPVMVGLRFIAGFFCGGVDTGANVIVPSIWGEKGGPYMQLLYLSYTIGGAISPLMTEPFLAPKDTPSEHHLPEPVNHTSYNSTVQLNSTVSDPNVTISTLMLPVYDLNPNFSSNVHIALGLIAILNFISSIPYIIMYCKGGFVSLVQLEKGGNTSSARETIEVTEDSKDEAAVKLTEITIEQEQDITPVTHGHGNVRTNIHMDSESLVNSTNKEQSERKKMTGKYLVCGLVCLSLVNILYSAAEEGLGAYIFTFTREYFYWDNEESAGISSLYWITSFIGGVSGVVLVQVLGNGKLLYMVHILWNLMFIGALTASQLRNDTLLWISISGSGLFMVQVIPAVISWTEETVCRINGKVVSIIMISAGVGVAANPAFLGFMMQTFSYLSFIYILLAEAILSLLAYLFGSVAAFTFYKKHNCEVVN